MRLKHGSADVPAFRQHVAEVYGRSDIPVKDLSEDIKRVETATDLERTGLLLFAGAALSPRSSSSVRPSSARRRPSPTRCRR